MWSCTRRHYCCKTAAFLAMLDCAWRRLRFSGFFFPLRSILSENLACGYANWSIYPTSCKSTAEVFHGRRAQEKQDFSIMASLFFSSGCTKISSVFISIFYYYQNTGCSRCIFLVKNKNFNFLSASASCSYFFIFVFSFCSCFTGC